MKLAYIPNLILETKFPVWEFIYDGYQTDPTPKSLVLGFFENPKTGNQLMAAINVRLLNTGSASRLFDVLDDVSAGKDTKERVRILRKMVKSIFDNAYRTYDVSKMKNVKKHSIDTKTEPTSKPVVKTATKPVIKTSTKPVVKTATKPTTKSTTKSMAKPITKPVAKPETKPVVKPETKPVIKPETVDIEPEDVELEVIDIKPDEIEQDNINTSN